jgi:hypothetical protein
MSLHGLPLDMSIISRRGLGDVQTVPRHTTFLYLVYWVGGALGDSCVEWIEVFERAAPESEIGHEPEVLVLGSSRRDHIGFLISVG